MKGKQDNVLVCHNQMFHPHRQNKVEDFRMVLEGNYRRAIVRQSHEGTKIQAALMDKKEGKRITLMNSRNDFHQPGVVHSSHSPLLK